MKAELIVDPSCFRKRSLSKLIRKKIMKKLSVPFCCHWRQNRMLKISALGKVNFATNIFSNVLDNRSTNEWIYGYWKALSQYILRRKDVRAHLFFCQTSIISFRFELIHDLHHSPDLDFFKPVKHLTHMNLKLTLAKIFLFLTDGMQAGFQERS